MPAATSAKWCTPTRQATTSKFVSEGQVFGEGLHVRLHPGRGVDSHNLEARLSELSSDMAAAGGDVEPRAGAAGPFDQEIEVGALAVRLALAVGVRAVVPDVRAHLSDTTFSAAESMVSST